MKRRISLIYTIFSVVFLAAPIGSAYAEDDRADRANDADLGGERLIYDPEQGQWIEVLPPKPGTEQGDLDIAKRLLARGDEANADDAKDLLEDWIKAYGKDGPLYGEVLFYQADAEFLTGNFMKAHELYQEYLNQFPGTPLAERAIHRDFVIAEVFLSGRKKKTWGFRIFTAYDEALEILDNIAIEHPDSILAEQAVKTKADYYFNGGEFGLAEDEYARLAREFPNSRYTSLAMLRSAQSALASFPGVQFDDASLIEAQERFQQFRTQYPIFAREQQIGIILEQIRSTRAHKEYVIGDYYQRTGATRAAVFYFNSVLKHWPDTTWASLAVGRLEMLDADDTSPDAEPSPPPAANVPMPEREATGS